MNKIDRSWNASVEENVHKGENQTHIVLSISFDRVYPHKSSSY